MNYCSIRVKSTPGLSRGIARARRLEVDFMRPLHSQPPDFSRGGLVPSGDFDKSSLRLKARGFHHPRKGTLMSAGIWLIALPAFLWIVKDEDFEEAEDRSEDISDFSTVLRQRSFWLLATAVLLIGFVDQAMSQNFVVYLDIDVGLGLAVADGAASTANFISIFGKVGFGWVYDKLSTKGVMICYVLMALAVLIAIPVQGSFLLGVLVLTRGLAHGGAIVDIPVLSKHCFGPKVLGRTIGVLTACGTVGFATGPPVMGYIHDTQGSYRYGFMLLAVMSLAAGAAVLGARPVYWEENIRKPARGASADATQPEPVP